MTKKQRLELTWIGKEIRPKLEPRILLEDPEKSYHAAYRVSENDIFDNRLIFGDNLLALKALEQEFTGKVKCIFIDPPYNTGSAFEHYDDGVEHSIWLGLMRDRLEILRNLLSEDGSIWITIDDNEAHYLKVMCDEIFGRANFVANVVWQKRLSPDIRATLGAGHDHLLVIAKSMDHFKNKIKPLPKNEKQKSAYRNPDNDPRGSWVSSDYTAQGYRPNQMYKITTPSGATFEPPAGKCWKNIESVFLKLVEDNRIWFGQDGSSMPRRKTFLSESEGQVAWTWWTNEEVGHTQEAKREIISIFGNENVFDTPKPERLLERIIYLSTNPGDLVLDSFAGSGTTGAVAHKMGRRWIMIELGEHCHTHIIPRLKKVIDGEDQGGISKTVNWKGGGGFRYYCLAPSLLEKDKWGNWIINKEYNPAMLAEALCKIEGFTYSPSDTFYWQHGYSTERDFIYVTTQNLSQEQLSQLADEVGQERTLLVLCSAFRGKVDIFPNLTIKKIPQQILSRCEWGHDDYSLKTENLPKATPKIEQPSPQKPQQQHIQQSLF
ncbi:site-specific DNA-methyltransferase [Dolichospermum lemmermannii CS-548]|uniref:site-specific DNA-methyltransferase n=1 Tax=Dolichospermum lemmermannii TaxID=54295 RepID=UPI00232D53FF|nr:site-specific DNA-methyltransferase [Dolichospermum lemmermannii]MDB9436358.1 site-specific DNA-methyltransferase [Dolichospermum lemmermannii CS-548]